MPEPRIGFVIGGVQKGGTTALARYLARHPGVALPDRLPGGVQAPAEAEEAWTKEAHVFDAPDFDEASPVEEIDRRFAARFTDFGAPRLHGDATPVYFLHPRIIERIARYNPAMKWIVLLRDPVERAISHYHMERGRGTEPLSLLRAVLAERGRLAGSWEDFGGGAAWRVHSYATRGRYEAQLATLHRHFPASRVLVLPSARLAREPAGVMREVHRFLGLPDLVLPPLPARVFEGRYERPRGLSAGVVALRWMLRKDAAAFRRRYPDLR